MKRTPQPNAPGGVPPLAWLVGESPLSAVHLRTWTLLSDASHCTVLAQVPVAWIMARVGQIAGTEAKGLPRVDFVLCNRKSHPVLAVQMIRGSGLESRQSAAETRRTQQLVVLLRGLPLRTWAWDADAPPSPRRLKEKLSGLLSEARQQERHTRHEIESEAAGTPASDPPPSGGAGSRWVRLRTWLTFGRSTSATRSREQSARGVWELDDTALKDIKLACRRILRQTPRGELALPHLFAVSRQLTLLGAAGLARIPTVVLRGAIQEIMQSKPRRQEAQAMALLMLHLQGLADTNETPQPAADARPARVRPAGALDVQEIGMSAFIDAEQAWDAVKKLP
jgi:hypothetical protein